MLGQQLTHFFWIFMLNTLCTAKREAILKSLKLYMGQLQKYGKFHLQAQLFTETTILGRPENESSEPEQSPGQASLGHEGQTPEPDIAF